MSWFTAWCLQAEPQELGTAGSPRGKYEGRIHLADSSYTSFEVKHESGGEGNITSGKRAAMTQSAAASQLWKPESDLLNVFSVLSLPSEFTDSRVCLLQLSQERGAAG